MPLNRCNTIIRLAIWMNGQAKVGCFASGRGTESSEGEAK